MARRAQSFLRWLWDADRDASLRSVLRQTPVAWVIFSLITVVGVVDFAWPFTSGLDQLTYRLGSSTARTAGGEWWRLLTAALVNPPIDAGSRVQSGPEHLVTNLFWLLLAGPRAERLLGARRFILLLIVAAFTSSVALFVGEPLFWGWGGGTSGAIAALGGALLLIAYVQRNESDWKRRYFIASLVFLGLVIVGSAWIPAGSNIVHLGGFLTGVALAGAWKAGWMPIARAGTAVATAIVLVAVSATGTKVALVRRADPAIVASTPIGRSPVLLILAFGSLWANGEGVGALTRIDPDTNRVVATIRARAGGGMVAAGGSLWVGGDRAVVEIDPERNRVRSRIRLPGEAPWGLAAGGGAIWATLPDQGKVARIDAQTREVVLTPVGRRPYAVIAGPTAVWVSSFDSYRISRLDLRTGRVAHEAGIKDRPYWMEFVRGSLWVGAGEGVYRVDPSRLNVITYVPVKQGVWQMAVDVNGQLWAAERFGFEVAQIDTRANKVIRRVRVGYRQPAGVAAADTVWVTDTLKREVLRVKPEEGGS